MEASGGRDKHLVEVREPINIDTNLKVRGVELIWQQPLDMLPVKGFDFTANFTYTNQEDDAPNAPPAAGVPPRTHNVTVYYERNGINARLSRQFTSRHVTNSNTRLTVPGGAYAYATDRAQYDLSLGLNLKQIFKFRHNTDLSLSAWNLTKERSATYTQFDRALFSVNDPGASYTLSLRTSF